MQRMRCFREYCFCFAYTIVIFPAFNLVECRLCAADMFVAWSAQYIVELSNFSFKLCTFIAYALLFHLLLKTYCMASLWTFFNHFTPETSLNLENKLLSKNWFVCVSIHLHLLLLTTLGYMVSIWSSGC